MMMHTGAKGKPRVFGNENKSATGRAYKGIRGFVRLDGNMHPGQFS
jgi:hypothetical protein